MKKSLILLFALVISVSIVGTANAALINNGNHLIYDTDLKITWYDYASGSQYSLSGGYQAAVDWAGGINVGGTVLGSWTLPTTINSTAWSWGYDGSTTAGGNITTSEMGHLFYVELGNIGWYGTDGSSGQPGWGLKNVGPFNYVGPYGNARLNPGVYWGSTDAPDPRYGSVTPSDSSMVWCFDFSSGVQDEYGKSSSVYSFIAVHPGDIGGIPPSPVPEPATAQLLVIGIAGLAAFRRRMRRRG